MKQILCAIILLIVLIGCVPIEPKNIGNLKQVPLPPPPTMPGISTSQNIGVAVGKAVPSWATANGQAWAHDPIGMDLSPLTSEGKFDKVNPAVNTEITGYDLVWSQGYYTDTTYILGLQSTQTPDATQVWETFDIKKPDGTLYFPNGGWIQVQRTDKLSAQVLSTTFQQNSNRLNAILLFACKTNGVNAAGYVDYDCNDVSTKSVKVKSDGTLATDSGRGSWMLKDFEIAPSAVSVGPIIKLTIDSTRTSDNYHPAQDVLTCAQGTTCNRWSTVADSINFASGYSRVITANTQDANWKIDLLELYDVNNNKVAFGTCLTSTCSMNTNLPATASANYYIKVNAVAATSTSTTPTINLYAYPSVSATTDAARTTAIATCNDATPATICKANKDLLAVYYDFKAVSSSPQLLIKKLILKNSAGVQVKEQVCAASQTQCTLQLTDLLTGTHSIEVEVQAPCVQNCAGKTCGDDGCGGNCGTCANGQTCTNNACAATPVIVQGFFKNAANNNCLGTGTLAVGRTLYNMLCPTDQASASNWVYDSNTKQIKAVSDQTLCLRFDQSTTLVKTAICSTTDQNQQWNYDTNSKQIKQETSTMCIEAEAGTATGALVKTCDTTSNYQKWNVVSSTTGSTTSSATINLHLSVSNPYDASSPVLFNDVPFATCNNIALNGVCTGQVFVPAYQIGLSGVRYEFLAKTSSAQVPIKQLVLKKASDGTVKQNYLCPTTSADCKFQITDDPANKLYSSNPYILEAKIGASCTPITTCPTTVQWSTCTSSSQTRSCSDGCGGTTTETQSCTIAQSLSVDLSSKTTSAILSPEQYTTCPAGKVACGAFASPSSSITVGSFLGKLSCCSPVGFSAALTPFSGVNANTQNIFCTGTSVVCGTYIPTFSTASYQNTLPGTSNAIRCCTTSGVQISTSPRLVAPDVNTGEAMCNADEVVCGTQNAHGGTLQAGFSATESYWYANKLQCCKITP